MILQVRHQTDYEYSAPVSQAVNEVCLRPRDTPLQRCLTTRLEIQPQPLQVTDSVDHFGNHISRFSLDQPHRTCSIITTSMIETSDELPTLPASPAIGEVAALLAANPSADSLQAQECLLPSRYVPVSHDVDPLVAELLQTLGTTGDGEGCHLLNFAETLMHTIFTTFKYDPSFSTLVTPVSEVLAARKGVCQDFAHLAIAVLRRIGIPARYVSGYLETLPPPGQQKLQGSDASHAWFSVYVPVAGWFDFDPTNDKRPDAQYITTAWGRDYGDVAPLKGVVFGGGAHSLSVAVDVNRTGEARTDRGFHRDATRAL